MKKVSQDELTYRFGLIIDGERTPTWENTFEFEWQVIDYVISIEKDYGEKVFWEEV